MLGLGLLIPLLNFMSLEQVLVLLTDKEMMKVFLLFQKILLTNKAGVKFSLKKKMMALKVFLLAITEVILIILF
ncbi:MAG: hypothetical protein COB96_06355 [Planctomycetota bacterium]|nr:MAG: hypothetical protein COB96_06355 [Planctomycetota bacterium]